LNAHWTIILTKPCPPTPEDTPAIEEEINQYKNKIQQAERTKYFTVRERLFFENL